MSNDKRPGDLKYTKSHEWARIEEGEAWIGISDFAVEHLSDLTFLDLPEVGEEVSAGESFGEIESVKAVADLNAPLSGEVVEVNTELADNLEMLAESPFEKGWLIKIRMSAPSEAESLLGLEAYEEQIRKEEEEG